MNEQVIIDALKLTINSGYEVADTALAEASRAQDFKEAQLRTNDQGLVLTMQDGSEFQVTIHKSARFPNPDTFQRGHYRTEAEHKEWCITKIRHEFENVLRRIQNGCNRGKRRYALNQLKAQMHILNLMHIVPALEQDALMEEVLADYGMGPEVEAEQERQREIDYKVHVVQECRKQVERSVRRNQNSSACGDRKLALISISSDLRSLSNRLLGYGTLLSRNERLAIIEEILTAYGMGVEWPEQVYHEGREFEFLGDTTRNPITGIEYREYISGDSFGTYRIMVDQRGIVNPHETL